MEKFIPKLVKEEVYNALPRELQLDYILVESAIIENKEGRLSNYDRDFFCLMFLISCNRNFKTEEKKERAIYNIVECFPRHLRCLVDRENERIIDAILQILFAKMHRRCAQNVDDPEEITLDELVGKLGLSIIKARQTGRITELETRLLLNEYCTRKIGFEGDF